MEGLTLTLVTVSEDTNAAGNVVEKLSPSLKRESFSWYEWFLDVLFSCLRCCDFFFSFFLSRSSFLPLETSVHRYGDLDRVLLALRLLVLGCPGFSTHGCEVFCCAAVDDSIVFAGLNMFLTSSDECLTFPSPSE